MKSQLYALLSAEYRDDEIGRHMHRVGKLSALLALTIGRPHGEIAILRAAAPLHDVGKIGVPDYILEKPGKLTDAEFNKMKSHTLLGGEILGGSQSAVLQIASQIALSHHERWDGTGYPHGLAGNAIPLPARITAIVDVFDALTHTRPYKEAWNPERALELIEKESGRQFDPTLVSAFLYVLGGSRDVSFRHLTGCQRSSKNVVFWTSAAPATSSAPEARVIRPVMQAGIIPE